MHGKSIQPGSCLSLLSGIFLPSQMENCKSFHPFLYSSTFLV